MSKNMNDTVAEIIIKVYLVNGGVMTHTYKVPKTESEIAELIRNLVGKMFILRRKSTDELLEFSNPHIYYNSDNVTCIKIDSVGVKELEEIMRKAKAKLGF